MQLACRKCARKRHRLIRLR